MSTRKTTTSVKAKWVKPEISAFNKKKFIQSGALAFTAEATYSFKSGS